MFLKSAAGAAALPLLANLDADRVFADSTDKSQVFRVSNCPSHDGEFRHVGMDALLHLLSQHGTKFYKSAGPGTLNGPHGLIAANDVVILKVNAQWKCRGCTNTDMLRGFIHRILQHPDGFKGEVVIFENGQGRPASFDGIHNDMLKDEYKPFPELAGKVMVNAEEQHVTTIDYLVNRVFKSKPVSSFLMDPHANTWIGDDDHVTNGYRRIGIPGSSCISYPCFTTSRGNRIELREGRWTGSDYAENLKLIHCPVLKDHSGDIGMTGALKIVYGTLSMSDGTSARRHYADLGSQCARMWTEVRAADLNILDCIWVSHGSMTAQGQHVSGCIGYPPEITSRQDVLLAGHDPLAIDYYANRHILLPLGGNSAEAHDPDNNPRLVSVYRQAQETINAAGGIRGRRVYTEAEHIELLSADASNEKARKDWEAYA
ncbi:MAG TPA: DUF362 domain-containing protein [Terracidiphilus sp.]|nr:DUF362 domain-containing protein [Terracidiphilus sp.]